VDQAIVKFPKEAEISRFGGQEETTELMAFL